MVGDMKKPGFVVVRVGWQPEEGGVRMLHAAFRVGDFGRAVGVGLIIRFTKRYGQ
jgi:hypothetical protein